MLVLTRKVNQQIQLGNDITITVLRIQGNQIRIGIEAPRDVRIVRGELQPLPAQEITIVADAEFADEQNAFEQANEECSKDGVPALAVDRALRVGGPLSGFFPRSVELAVANLSV